MSEVTCGLVTWGMIAAEGEGRGFQGREARHVRLQICLSWHHRQTSIGHTRGIVIILVHELCRADPSNPFLQYDVGL